MSTRLLTAIMLLALISPAFALTDIAVNQPITAGTVSGPSYSASKANDGNKATYWQGTKVPDVVKISLSSIRLVDNIVVRMPIIPSSTPYTNHQKMLIETSTDNVNWTSRTNGIVNFHYCDGSKPSGAPSNWTGACSYKMTFGVNISIEVRYFRITIYDRYKNGIKLTGVGGQIASIEINGF